MNYVMYEGKKAVAENIVYGAFDILEAKRKDQARWRPSTPPLTTSPRPSKCAPAGSAAPPIRCRWKCVPSAAARWPSAGWSTAARKRGENTMTEKLAGELLDASNNRGAAVKKREDTHKMAEANRAFSHYRW